MALVKRAISMNTSGKGGARHTPKPQVDIALLVKCVLAHTSLLTKLGIYENVSKNQSCSPKSISPGFAIAKMACRLGAHM